MCVCVCVFLRLAGWKWTPPTPSLPPSGFPVLCCSNWKRLLISHKLWLFTVTFPSSSSSSSSTSSSARLFFSKVCPRSFFFSLLEWWCDGFSSQSVVLFFFFLFFFFFFCNHHTGFPPHPNSWAVSLSRPTLNRPLGLQPGQGGKNVRTRLRKVARSRVSVFVTLKLMWRTARLSGCWVLLCSKVVGQGTTGISGLFMGWCWTGWAC